MDIANQLKDILQDENNKKSKIQEYLKTLSNEEFQEFIKNGYSEFNPYNTLTGPYKNIKDEDLKLFNIISYTNLNEHFQKRYIMVSLTAFLYQMLHEYKNSDDNKLVIKTFLDKYLSFDPSQHIRSSAISTDKKQQDVLKDMLLNGKRHISYSEKYNRLLSTTISENEECQYILDILSKPGNEFIRNTALGIINPDYSSIINKIFLHKEELTNILQPSINFINNIIPQDTFCRWNRYDSTYMEELKQITEVLYPDKSGLDSCLAIWDSKLCKSPDDAKKWFTSFTENNKDSIITDLVLIPSGRWLVLSNYKKNKLNVEVDNKILHQMMDRLEEDNKLGSKLVKDRVTDMKLENINKYGLDEPILDEYKKLSDVDTLLTKDELKIICLASGDKSKYKELQIINNYKSELSKYDEIKINRDLTKNEQIEYDRILSELRDSLSLLQIPDNTIKMEGYITDHKDNSMTKKDFLTQPKFE